MDRQTSNAIQAIEDAVAYTNNELLVQPDGRFDQHTGTMELEFYCQAIIENVSRWEWVLFEGKVDCLAAYTMETYPLLIEAINRITIIQNLNDIGVTYNPEMIQILIDAAYDLCLEILRYLSPLALQQVYDVLDHQKK